MPSTHDSASAGSEGGHARGEFRGALDVALDLPLASLGTRSLAHLVDALILLGFVLFSFGALTLAPVTGDARWWLAASVIVIDFLLIWGYFVAFELSTAGQSPGKKLLRLRVVTQEGTPPGPAASLIRNLVRYADFLPPFYGFGSLSILLTERGQRLGDLAAGTLVVREPPTVEGATIDRWPKAIPPQDVELVEEYFERARSLPVARHREIANAMLRWLAATYPDFTGPVPADRSPEVFLEDCFSKRGDALRERARGGTDR